jgi:hypothetical protein
VDMHGEPSTDMVSRLVEEGKEQRYSCLGGECLVGRSYIRDR